MITLWNTRTTGIPPFSPAPDNQAADEKNKKTKKDHWNPPFSPAPAPLALASYGFGLLLETRYIAAQRRSADDGGSRASSNGDESVTPLAIRVDPFTAGPQAPPSRRLAARRWLRRTARRGLPVERLWLWPASRGACSG